MKLQQNERKKTVGIGIVVDNVKRLTNTLSYFFYTHQFY